MDGLHQQLQFAAGALVVGQEQLGVAADLPQLQQHAEHLHPGPGQRTFIQRLTHVLPQGGQQRLIDPLLLRRHGGVQILLVLFRQVAEHLALQAAHQEGPDPLPQLLRPFATAVAAQERGLGAQIAGQDEVEDAPQFAGVVLHGGAGQRHPHLRIQLLGRQRPLTLGVLDGLGLVQHGEAQGNVLIVFNVPAKQGIAGQDHVHRIVLFQVGDGVTAFVPLPGHHPDDESVVETLHFCQPVIGQGSRGDDDAFLRTVLLFGGGQGGDDLQRFAKAHLVRQNAAHPGLVQGQEPIAAPALIGRQLLLQLLGHIVLFRGLAQGLNGLLRFLVRLSVRPGHAKHTDHVGGPVRAEAQLSRVFRNVGFV